MDLNFHSWLCLRYSKGYARNVALIVHSLFGLKLVDSIDFYDGKSMTDALMRIIKSRAPDIDSLLPKRLHDIYDDTKVAEGTIHSRGNLQRAITQGGTFHAMSLYASFLGRKNHEAVYMATLITSRTRNFHQISILAAALDPSPYISMFVRMAVFLRKAQVRMDARIRFFVNMKLNIKSYTGDAAGWNRDFTKPFKTFCSGRLRWFIEMTLRYYEQPFESSLLSRIVLAGDNAPRIDLVDGSVFVAYAVKDREGTHHRVVYRQVSPELAVYMTFYLKEFIEVQGTAEGGNRIFRTGTDRLRLTNHVRRFVKSMLPDPWFHANMCTDTEHHKECYYDFEKRRDFLSLFGLSTHKHKYGTYHEISRIIYMVRSLVGKGPDNDRIRGHPQTLVESMYRLRMQMAIGDRKYYSGIGHYGNVIDSERLLLERDGTELSFHENKVNDFAFMPAHSDIVTYVKDSFSSSAVG
jgi:hypothetical protein